MWGIIFVIAIVILAFFKSANKESKQMELSEGITTKYRNLIKKFDDFDRNNKPVVLADKTNWYEIGWSAQTTIATIVLFETSGKLHVNYQVKYNINALKRNGIDIKSLPDLNTKLKWSFDTTEDQNYIAKEIANGILSNL